MINSYETDVKIIQSDLLARIAKSFHDGFTYTSMANTTPDLNNIIRITQSHYDGFIYTQMANTTSFFRYLSELREKYSKLYSEAECSTMINEYIQYIINNSTNVIDFINFCMDIRCVREHNHVVQKNLYSLDTKKINEKYHDEFDIKYIYMRLFDNHIITHMRSFDNHIILELIRNKCKEETDISQIQKLTIARPSHICFGFIRLRNN